MWSWTVVPVLSIVFPVPAPPIRPFSRVWGCDPARLIAAAPIAPLLLTFFGYPTPRDPRTPAAR